LRDKKGILERKENEKIKKKLGDVLCYLTPLCTELKLSLENVAKTNIEKLRSRKKRKELKGKENSK